LARLSVRGVGGRQGSTLEASPLEFEAGIAYITVDTDNNTIVDDADDEAFRKDASRAFTFWDGDPYAESLNQLSTTPVFVFVFQKAFRRRTTCRW
jgi:hypothetical protein